MTNALPAIPVIPPERADDLHHLDILDRADLTVFMAGNQYMVLPQIMGAFQEQYANVKHIFYETLPPGLELKQILCGGAMFNGTLLDCYPDVYASVSLTAMETLENTGHISPSTYYLYLHNRLTLMVAEGNPKQITSVRDLARSDVRISQPDPENEDIAFHIMDMYRSAGGEALVTRIMEEKRARGTTLFTLVHHRETPERLSRGEVDVGPVWSTEWVHARRQGQPFEAVDPGPGLDQRDHINYYICRTEKAPHPGNAEKFITFIRSPAAQKIYAAHGFLPHQEAH